MYKDKLAWNAAIGRRAAKITARVCPLPHAPHGFYQPEAFVEHMRLSAARNQFYRETCRRLAVKQAARDLGVTRAILPF